jgi:amylosucrase
VLGYQRLGTSSSVVCLANFDDQPQWVGREVFQFREAWDIITSRKIDLNEGIHLMSHQYVWLERR